MLERYAPPPPASPPRSQQLLGLLVQGAAGSEAVAFLAFAALVCRIGPAKRSPELIAAHGLSPFAHERFDGLSESPIRVSVTEIESIRLWPPALLAQQEFGFDVRLEGSAFDEVARLLRASEREKGAYRDIVARIRRFCADTLPSLRTARPDTPGFKKRFSARNRLFDDVQARLSAEFAARMRKLLRLVLSSYRTHISHRWYAASPFASRGRTRQL
jgi:hypothetical protein